nr:hypothetical protein [Tanacetum cinerariifolium]
KDMQQKIERLQAQLGDLKGCLSNSVNGKNSCGKNQKAKVSVKEIQKKYLPKVSKPKKVGTRESLATPKPRKSRLLLRWSPTGKLFDKDGKIVDSNESKSQFDCYNGDNACTSNILEPKIKRFPNSTYLLDSFWELSASGMIMLLIFWDLVIFSGEISLSPGFISLKDWVTTCSRMTIETHNWSSSAHQELHKIIRDEIFPIVNQVDARLQNFEIQFLKEAAKFVGDFKSLTKEADDSLAKNKALKLEIERLLKAVVSHDVMNIVHKESVVDTSDLQTELERTKEHFENCIIKKET